MELGSQNVQELTGYIEEMFSEYMTFPTILFIVAIVVALSSIACFILAPFYIKGKARGAKTAAQVISVIDFIIGILLILAFIIITLLFNMASDGFFDSADGFLKAVRSSMQLRNLNYPVVIMRSDGSLMNETYALKVCHHRHGRNYQRYRTGQRSSACPRRQRHPDWQLAYLCQRSLCRHLRSGR